MTAILRQVQPVRGDRSIALGSMVMFVSVGVLLFLFNPTTNRFFPPCPLYLTTGCYCPGCGATRATHQLIRGEFITALSFNALMVLALPLIGYVYIGFLTRALAGRQLPSISMSRWVPWGLIIFVLVFAIIRNIPLEPLTWLAP